ncbi:DNA ligase D [Bordetella hinzii]|uniref:DNA ligase (ATP) n=1 Tax=Bordetella hinzii TaxID=103855 RepID=A0AAN1S000_9BORD|nr:DNA ligase D [Bordetella hinzii]AKQ60399.1 Putative DNA ligase-like protein [Bordetella hinzii]AZW18548.1 ATP-dependent DNA ligase [Bordetella hinzii]MBZ0076999.1 DNA ligase D [Bordetella hinzii]MBZ0081618.1 DNA ligase D [Bordetella hinzii]MBZ0085924.1 DNA ligase D [Bordetella hinzii]
MADKLRAYRRKRDFETSPEPRGGTPDGGQPLFVVQKHAARRLHYDFRLQIGGVLASWAVPKGPSMDPGVKRLAVHVEDHPLDYAQFEGDIPAGHYGAGHVDIWDSGHWEARGNAARGLAQGHLRFRLHGRRLHGDWLLVRTHGEQWLLRKVRDTAPARPAPAARAALPGKAAAMPRQLRPPLATLAERPPPDAGWRYEVKYDGYRMLCELRPGRVRFISRSGHDWTARMRPLAEAIAALKLGQGWLDGEVVVFDRHGISDFQLLQNALDGEADGLRFVVFDLPYWEGRDLRGMPLSVRQHWLEVLLEHAPAPLMLTQRLALADVHEANQAWTQACQLHLEGLIAKRADAAYRPGRGHDWLKLKCRPRQEFVIGGYTPPSGARQHFGALLLGLRRGKRLQYVGRTGTGFTDASLRRLMARLRPLAQADCPFVQRPPDSGQAHWVRPELVAEVAYAGVTADQRLRQAAFIALREDKPAAQVDDPAPEPPARPRRTAMPDRIGKIAITHPDRIVLRDPDTSKLELARYYEAIGPRILPHLQKRRVALVRYPDGADKPGFFQKHITTDLPKGVSRDAAGDLTIDSLEGLIALVQLGVIELHTWGSRAPKTEAPDRLTLDLDPGEGVDWRAIVEGAQLARGLMQEVGLVPFLKSTGGKGLHLVAPLKPIAGWEDVKALAHGLASRLESVLPGRFVANMAKAKRRGRIFVDYLRNGNGATAIAAFSVRGRAGGPVSMPLPWELLDAGEDLRGPAFNLRNARQWAETHPDPWADYAASRRQVGPRMLARLGLEPAQG